MNRISYTFAALLLLTSGAMAACPPETGGTTAAEIQANQARVVCLQNELAAETRLKQLEFDVQSNQRQLQDLQLQQRLQAIPKFVPPVIYVPPVVQPVL
ncbi:hypothetical protein SAMN05428969_3608 [Devosia sp. YR412]|uniref:hypothetical protein n=1 Tax=Devosia sp. YR412 TaxID=1881030 RepID=UPI0008B8CC35|nr:hypothetical protein [Devosia sp. YR412]SEQ58500.1 hypothetical protein SAMN05428969_3608 [Devosia sp. YR412]